MYLLSLQKGQGERRCLAIGTEPHRQLLASVGLGSSGLSWRSEGKCWHGVSACCPPAHCPTVDQPLVIWRTARFCWEQEAVLHDDNVNE
jgi:hypothetical protein